jgi:uncharacterized protein YdeI (YjbR/CyaY-like superfamily)
MSTGKGKSLGSLVVADASAWRLWLADQATTSPGVWLLLAKRGTVEPTTLSLDQAVEEALCFGWINGQGRSNDDSTFYGRLTPRGPKSMWSQRNVDIVNRLEREGRMQEEGRRTVDAAKADGRWQKAYAGGVATAEMPEDLLAAIEANQRAQETWTGLSKASRYMMYLTLINLKTSTGRKNRIENYVSMMASGETPHSRPANEPTASSKTRGFKRKHSVDMSQTFEACSRTTVTRSGRQIRPSAQ